MVFVWCIQGMRDIPAERWQEPMREEQFIWRKQIEYISCKSIREEKDFLFESENHQVTCSTWETHWLFCILIMLHSKICKENSPTDYACQSSASLRHSSLKQWKSCGYWIHNTIVKSANILCTYCIPQCVSTSLRERILRRQPLILPDDANALEKDLFTVAWFCVIGEAYIMQRHAKSRWSLFSL